MATEISERIYDAHSLEYVQAVLSYAPYSQWREVITSLDLNISENSHRENKTYIQRKLLAVDSLYGPFGEVVKAKEYLQEINEVLLSIEPKDEDWTQIQTFFEAMKAYIGKDYSTGFNFFMTCLQQDKSDLFFCKKAQLMALLGGFNKKILEPCVLINNYMNNNSRQFFSGMLVFAYEQNEDYVKAEKVALKSMKNSDRHTDGWLDHGYT